MPDNPWFVPGRRSLPARANGSRLVLRFGATMCAACAVAFAFVQPSGLRAQQPPTESATSQPAASGPATASPTPPHQPTAEEVIKALQTYTQPPRPVIRPNPPPGIVRDSAAPLAATPLPAAPSVTTRGRLLPEDYRLVDRPGRLVRHPTRGWQFVFEDRGTGEVEPPMVLLPNLMLQAMEELSQGQVRSPVFIVSGDVTEYRGENFLLARKVYIRPELGNLK